MKTLLTILLALVLLFGALLWFAPSLFDRNTVVDDWQPTASPAMAADGPSAKQNCLDANPFGNAYFGDLHIHTAYSMDARSRDMLSTPADAYRFAQGYVAGLGPFDANGKPQRARRLSRPLDFAAVTDHAEWIGEINICTSPGSPSFDTEDCRAYRGEPDAEFSGFQGIIGRFFNNRMFGLRGSDGRKSEICGPNDVLCRHSLKSAWLTNQAATEAANDTTENCRFTAFHGWEFSDGPGMSKVHRNVIFRNDRVPEIPVSAFETPGPTALWSRLDELCNNTNSGCEAITIPHNPNVSNGRMFTVSYLGESLAEQRRIARQRARYEPVVEMMQIKGESECKPGMWGVLGEDELCDFEKIRGLAELGPKDCKADYGSGAIAGLGCESRLDFARYALIEGLIEEQRIGINPYQFGLIGGTDNHNAAPGDVSEHNYEGCCANTDVNAESRLSMNRGFAGKGPVARNPGGLMGVWAVQNTRNDLFAAIKKRQVFATSGPRIVPRLFATWNVDAVKAQQEGGEELVCAGNPNERLKGGGVPMGGELHAVPGSRSPMFIASAIADAGTPDEPGAALQRLQIIKVWHDNQGQYHQQVNDVAGAQNNGAGVELSSCAITQDDSIPVKRMLCGTWQDPDYSPSQSAAYYLRVLENPTCRWSWRHCLAQADGQKSQSCSDPSVPKTIQERAWTSPIWLNAS